jgi:hypothetical protein
MPIGFNMKGNEKTKKVSGYKMDEEKKQQMRAFLDLVGDRIEVLECLVANACFSPIGQ